MTEVPRDGGGADEVGAVSATYGPAVGINRGVINHFVGPFRELRRQFMDLTGLPAELGLSDPAGSDQVGLFTGREALIGRIDAFVAASASAGIGRYLLVEAEAGMGKSALATFLYVRRGWPMHATRVADDPSPEAARRNLGAQLIARWQLADAAPGGILPADHDSPLWLREVLREAVTAARDQGDGGPVVLLVDGIDEAPAPIPGHLPLGLPRQLPGGVVVVLTGRPGAPIPAGPQVERIDVESGLNRADLLAYLRRVTLADPALAAAFAGAAAEREHFCRTLLDRSGGVWIYALSVLDQIAHGSRSPADIDALPAGLAAYYTNNVLRWRGDPAAGWPDRLAPLLGTLAAAREARPVRTLARWAGLPPAEVTTALHGPLKAFLVTRRGGTGDLDTYALRHQSLRDFCAGQVPGDSPGAVWDIAGAVAGHTTAAHGRILDAVTPAGDWSDDLPDAEYARLHLGHHAAECGRLDELVSDPGFLLFAPLAELLRLRRRAGTATEAVTAALAAVELASNSWPTDPHQRLRHLLVCARKTHATRLGDAIDRRIGSGWRAAAASWPGISHRVLPTDQVDTAVAVPLPDGRTVLAAGNHVTTLWDTTTGLPVGAPLPGHRSLRTAMAVPLPDGRTILATTGDGWPVRVHHLDTDGPGRDGRGAAWPGDPVATAPVGDHIVAKPGTMVDLTAMTLPSGTTVLVSTDSEGRVRLWDPATGRGRELARPRPPAIGLTTLPTQHGPLLVMAHEDNTATVLDPTTGAVVGRVDERRPLPPVPRPRQLGTDALVRVVSDRFALVPVSTRDGDQVMWTLWYRGAGSTLGGTAPDLTLRPVALPLADRILLASADRNGRAGIWDPARREHRTLDGAGHVTAMTAVPVSDGQVLLATAARDRTIRLWDPSGLPVGHLVGASQPVEHLVAVAQPDGHALIAAVGDNRILLWDPAAARQGQGLDGHSGTVTGVAAVALPDGRTVLASAGLDRTVRLWDPATGRGLGQPLDGHPDRVLGLAAVSLPGGPALLLSAGGDGTARLWDATTGRLLRVLTGHRGRVLDATALPTADGRVLVVTAGDDGLLVWDPTTGHRLGEPLVGHTAAVNAVTTLPSSGGHLLLSAGDDGTVRLWAHPHAGPIDTVVGHLGPVNDVTVHRGPDGRVRVATAGSDATIRLWDPATGEQARPLTGHTGPVTAVTPVPDPGGPDLLASAGHDGTIRLWDPTTGESLGEPLTGHSGQVRDLIAFTAPDGSTLLASAGADRTVVVWRNGPRHAGPTTPGERDGRAAG